MKIMAGLEGALLVLALSLIGLIIGLLMATCPHWVANRIAPHRQRSISAEIQFVGIILIIVLVIAIAFVIISIT